MPIIYKGLNLGDYHIDLLVENEIEVEIDAVDRIESVFEAQISTYLKVTCKKLRLLMNVNVPNFKKWNKKNNTLSLCASVVKLLL